MILQKYPGDEAQYMCDMCNEAITNPICHFCLAEQIEVWLTHYPQLKKEILPKINNYLKKTLNRITTYGTECIKCKKNRASVCPYCFTEYVFDKLQEINTSKLILREFVEFFNFDLEFKGYYKEFEQLGIIQQNDTDRAFRQVKSRRY